MWVAVNKNGDEWAYQYKPASRSDWDTWVGGYYDTGVIMPTGTIERLLGRKLTWEDDPVEIAELNN